MPGARESSAFMREAWAPPTARRLRPSRRANPRTWCPKGCGGNRRDRAKIFAVFLIWKNIFMVRGYYFLNAQHVPEHRENLYLHLHEDLQEAAFSPEFCPNSFNLVFVIQLDSKHQNLFELFRDFFFKNEIENIPKQMLIQRFPALCEWGMSDASSTGNNSLLSWKSQLD